jgi:hypothetical protein
MYAHGGADVVLKIDLVVVMVPPVPILVLFGFIATFPFDVVPMGFVLPLDVICRFSRSPYIDLPVLGTTRAQDRHHQY